MKTFIFEMLNADTLQVNVSADKTWKGPLQYAFSPDSLHRSKMEYSMVTHDIVDIDVKYV